MGTRRAPDSVVHEHARAEHRPMLGMLEHIRAAKRLEHARGPLFECARAAKTLSRAKVPLFERAQAAKMHARVQESPCSCATPVPEKLDF